MAMSATCRKHLKQLQDRSGWLYVTIQGPLVTLAWGYRSGDYIWVADRRDPVSIRYVIHDMGVQAARKDSPVTFYEIAIITRLFCTAYYDGAEGLGV